MNKLVESFRHPIETFRTAPFWTAKTLGSVSSTLCGIYIATAGVQMEGAPEKLLPVAGTAIAINGLRKIWSNSKATAHYLTMRDRMEEALSRQGYSDRLVAPRLDPWCARQATYMACKNFDPQAGVQFRALIEANREELFLTSIRC